MGHSTKPANSLLMTISIVTSSRNTLKALSPPLTSMPIHHSSLNLIKTISYPPQASKGNSSMLINSCKLAISSVSTRVHTPSLSQKHPRNFIGLLQGNLEVSRRRTWCTAHSRFILHYFHPESCSRGGLQSKTTGRQAPGHDGAHMSSISEAFIR